MENAQRRQDLSSRSGAQEQARKASRAVPSDWFLDPADPDAGQSLSQSLEDQATAFLAAHDLGEEEDIETAVAHDNVTALRRPTNEPTRTRTNLPGEDTDSVGTSIWLGLPGFGDTADEGELAWQADALCAQTDPEAFFPEKGGSTRDAKKVCSACTVRQQCLDYALANDERFGIWGGMSERERRKLRKKSS